MVRALLWDHDGVLVDTEGLYFQATREALEGVGVALTAEDYRQNFLVEGGGALNLLRARGFHETAIAELRHARGQRYMALLSQENVVLPDALSIVRRAAQHFRMAIVTSSRRDHFERIHEQSGIPAHFELILTREAYVNSKPDPEPYLTALARLSLRAEECLVIEDSERGLRAARAAGLKTWVVPSTLTAGSSFEGAERRFSALSEVGIAIEQLALSRHTGHEEGAAELTRR